MYGYNTNSQTATTNGRTANTNANLVTARAAAIGALTSGTDTSGGGVFLGGIDLYYSWITKL